LLYVDKVSDKIYLGLMGCTILVAFILPNMDRLVELDIKNLKATLSEIRQEKNEIKKLGEEITELIALNSTFQNRCGSEKICNLIKK
jgi:hypothetical protein